MIENSTLSDRIKKRAIDIFSRVAMAEARMHGTTVEKVHFHEVGAIDSVVDIVGAAIALDYFSPLHITARPIPLGRGWTHCQHGTLPVPAPAVLEILKGKPVEDGGAAVELCTPTGAAIVASCVDSFGPLPSAKVINTGMGAGDVVLEDRPNILRLVLMENENIEPIEHEAIVLEANIDDMSSEWCSHLMEQLFAAGAKDVWFIPIVMKKGRPALTICALCEESLLKAVGDAFLRESTTIGLRYYHTGRRALRREIVEVSTRYGPLVVKLAFDGETLMNVAPEFDSCKAAAEKFKAPLKEIFSTAMAAYHALAKEVASK